jgi:hypothetical protein
VLGLDGRQDLLSMVIPSAFQSETFPLHPVFW